MNKPQRRKRTLSTATQGPPPVDFSGLYPHKPVEVPLILIDPNPMQHRKFFDENRIGALAQSIEKRGLIHPIKVRALDSGRYRIIAGERRYLAYRQLDRDAIPAVIETGEGQMDARLSVIENKHREDLNPYEELQGILLAVEQDFQLSPREAPAFLRRLYRDHKLEDHQEEVQKFEALRQELGVGALSSIVTNMLPILSYPQELLEVLQCGLLDFTKARRISQVKDPVARNRILKHALSDPGISYREVDHLVRKAQQPESKTRNGLHALLKQQYRKAFKKAPAEDLKRAEQLIQELEHLLGRYA